jgi:hypothetical protein
MNQTTERLLCAAVVNRRATRRRLSSARPHTSSNVVLSVLLHVIMLGGLVHLANLPPSQASFDVFAADPLDPASEPAGAPSPRAPSASKPATASARRRPAPTVSSRASSATVPEAGKPTPAPGAIASHAHVDEAPAFAGTPAAVTVRAHPPTGAPASTDPVPAPPSPDPVTSADGGSGAPLETLPAVAPLAPGVPAAEPPPPSRVSILTPEPVLLDTVDGPDGAVPPRSAPARESVPSPSPSAPVSTPARRPAPPTASRSSSPLGLALDHLRIRLDGAPIRTTDRDTDVVSGTLVGGQPERLVVQVGERMSVPTLTGRTFATTVTLSPGINRVRVLATDAQGAEVEQIVTVEYRPPAAPDLAITSPRDGHTLAPGDVPLLVVEGEATDPTLTTVWIVANDRRMMTAVTAGRFRYHVPIVEPIVHVRAETGSDDRRSQTVTVHAAAATPAIGLFLGDWPRQMVGPAQMTVTWRANPAMLDTRAQPLALPELTAELAEAGTDVFYLRHARPGVYTFLLTYRAGSTPTARPVLYVNGTARPLASRAFDGSGRAVVARLLLPHGVLWEDDDWFTGRSASGDTVTKFRFPDGVSWTERRGDLGR